MGLSSGAIHITGLVKHLVVRLAQLVSHVWPTGLLGYPFNFRLTAPPQAVTRTTTMTDIACVQTSQETPTIQRMKASPTCLHQKGQPSYALPQHLLYHRDNNRHTLMPQHFTQPAFFEPSWTLEMAVSLRWIHGGSKSPSNLRCPRVYFYTCFVGSGVHGVIAVGRYPCVGSWVRSLNGGFFAPSRPQYPQRNLRSQPRRMRLYYCCHGTSISDNLFVMEVVAI